MIALPCFVCDVPLHSRRPDISPNTVVPTYSCSYVTTVGGCHCWASVHHYALESGLFTRIHLKNKWSGSPILRSPFSAREVATFYSIGISLLLFSCQTLAVKQFTAQRKFSQFYIVSSCAEIQCMPMQKVQVVLECNSLEIIPGFCCYWKLNYCMSDAKF